MFSETGWISLAEAADAIYAHFSKAASDRLAKFPVSTLPDVTQDAHEVATHGGFEFFAAGCIWEMLEESPKVEVLCANGVRVMASKLLIRWGPPSWYQNQHINPSVGTIGSGLGQTEGEDRNFGHSPEALYGPFLGLPIVLQSSFFEAYMLKLQSMGDLEQVTQSDELTAQIIAKFDVDNTMTKAWAKKNLAADMKQIGFEFAWKNATEQRPMLKKPGPRGPRK